jgi:hypothetical protein
MIDSPALKLAPKVQRALLIGLAVAFFAMGIRGAWASFSHPPDERVTHLVALSGGLFVGLSLAVLLLLGRRRMENLLGESGWGRGLVVCLTVAFLILSAVWAIEGFVYPADERAHELFLRSGVFFGLGLGNLCILLQSLLDRILRGNVLFYGCVALAGIAVALVIYWCGMRQLGGFDHSIVIDSGWKVVSGQRPVADFPSTSPIGFVLGAYYAFKVCGVSWAALVISFAFFSVALFLWSLWLLSQLVESRWQRLLLVIALQALCTIPVSYWWYNPISTTSGVIFSLSAYLWLRDAGRRAAEISFCLSLFLLAAMKPNVAGCLIPPIVLILFSSRLHRIRVSVLSALTFVLFTLWLRFYGISLSALIQGYRGVAGQALAPGPFFADPWGFEALLAIVALAYIMLALAGCFRIGFGARWRFVGIGVACVLGGLANYVSAGETKLVDLGIIMYGVILACHGCGAWDPATSVASRPALRNPLAAYLIFLAVTMGCAGVAVGITRHRVRGIGPNQFFQYALEKDVIHDGFFRGVRTGWIFKEVYAQVRSVVAESAGKRVFFGPRMQWGYAAFRLPSPPGQPAWWHPGVSFPLAEVERYVSRFVQTRSEVLIFLKNDMTYYPPLLVRAIQENYSEDETPSQLSVFRLKPGASAPPEVITSGAAPIKSVRSAVVIIDVPAIAPNGNFGTKVTLPGVGPTDQLLISPTGYAGTWGIYYDSPDTVTVNYNNTTGATYDPPPITFRITALQF